MADRGTFPCITATPPEAAAAIDTGDSWIKHDGAALRFAQSILPVRDVRLTGVPIAGALLGSVHEAGVPVPNCVVRVYERKSGAMVAEVRTDAAGLFAVPGVRKGSDDHYAIALDPDGGALYNALIFDRVIPV